MISGYNIQNFDLKYILRRREYVSDSQNSVSFSRIRNELVRSTNKQSFLKELGNFEENSVSCKGRIVYDMYYCARRDLKLNSYSLA